MERRNFVKNTGILILAAINGQKINFGRKESRQNKPFHPESLHYSFNALEPYIDAATMEFHYSKHYSSYIQNLNKAVKGSSYEGKDILNILQHVKSEDLAIRNNGGGYFNHSFFWKCLTPEKTAPSYKFSQQIMTSFGGMEQFKAAFRDVALNIFGSGWAWLIKGTDNRLTISTTCNQDNPMMPFASQTGQPLLGLDTWEHAYYLKYNNRRTDYINAFWHIVNWDFVSTNYSQNDNLD